MIDHSPLPWATGGDMPGQVWSELDGITVAICPTVKGHVTQDGARANAEFIVRAANGHNGLVDALEKAANTIAHAVKDYETFSEAAGKRGDNERQNKFLLVAGLLQEQVGFIRRKLREATR